MILKLAINVYENDDSFPTDSPAVNKVQVYFKYTKM